MGRMKKILLSALSAEAIIFCILPIPPILSKPFPQLTSAGRHTLEECDESRILPQWIEHRLDA